MSSSLLIQRGRGTEEQSSKMLEWNQINDTCAIMDSGSILA
jgi:hypothetical protein